MELEIHRRGDFHSRASNGALTPRRYASAIGPTSGRTNQRLKSLCGDLGVSPRLGSLRTSQLPAHAGTQLRVCNARSHILRLLSLSLK